MTLANIHTAQLLGDHAIPTVVEIHIGHGLPQFSIVGIPDGPCRETRDRVRAAILNTPGCTWPMQRITVATNPQTPRVTASMDLAIALGVLIASHQFDAERVNDITFIGELGLDGTLRRVPGIVALVHDASTPLIVIPQTQHVTPLRTNQHVVHAPNLLQVLGSLESLQWPTPTQPAPPRTQAALFEDVHVNDEAISALVIAATGRHSILLRGTTGSGKTMLPLCLPTIMPKLGAQERVDVERIHSAAGLHEHPGSDQVPLRTPHHSTSAAAVLGGATTAIRPGELSCAHHGVLSLDNLPKFAPAILDGIYAASRNGSIAIQRAARSIVLPARFLLVATTNDCPCAAPPRQCRCSTAAKDRHQRRIGNAAAFDLQLTVEPVLGPVHRWTTRDAQTIVADATSVAMKRQGCRNGELTDTELDRVAKLSAGSQTMLEDALRTGTLSARGASRVRRVARTIADLQRNDGEVLPTDAVKCAYELHQHSTEPDSTLTLSLRH